GGAAEFAVEPLDSNTQQLEAALAYVGKKFQVRGGYYGSWFTNDIKLVDTALTTGVNPYFLSQPLSNQAHQLFANGGYNFTSSTRGTFKVAYTKATQNETIPVGTGVPVFAGAPTNIDGEVDTTLVQAGVTSRLNKDFSWLANLRYYDSNDKTPQVRVIQTNPACATGSQCVDNTPVSYTTLSGKLEGTYRLMQGLNLIGGIEYANQDRTVPVGTPSGGTDLQRYVPWRTEVEETTYRLQLRRSLAETVNGSIAYLHSTRDGSDYTLTNEAESDEINPIHIADRERDRLRLMVDWTPTEPLTMTFNVESAWDKYDYTPSRPYGLREGTATNFSFDIAYSFSDAWQLTAFYAYDNTQAKQVGQRATTGGAAAAEKDAELEDIGDTLGVGLRGTLMPRLKVGVDALYVKNVNRYPEAVTLTGAGTLYPAGITGPLPDITNELTRLKLFATWALQKSSELRFDYIHEIWKTDDWSWLFANGTTFTYGTGTDGTQVTQDPKQTADYVGVRYIYRFQ
ncbi:MAG TPA: MtrB/PioB family decaheme-associated outer membrane protein, partial [Vicinamibacterales bacterium]|nr:MtrB/PioB family decaheme-associated outer membrane protein [Vicinamibacterales bacterium]